MIPTPEVEKLKSYHGVGAGAGCNSVGRALRCLVHVASPEFSLQLQRKET